jgi:hypothetical protein
MMGKAAGDGAVRVAEIAGAFLGFAAGWIENENTIEDTQDSRRYGLVSDLCVLEIYRGASLPAS